ncbi:MAG TPA: hypothetical protein VK826_01645 [Bacteroidia bacterium]|nr:hypothetical protein [Bacteroidia bacterium]
MKFLAAIVFVLLFTVLHAQVPSKKLRLGIFSSASYQVAVNGQKAATNLGNFGFKGYTQPSIGIGVKYEQDSTEFAIVNFSASNLVYSLGSANIIYDGNNSYDIINSFDIFLHQYALEASYHRRFAQIDSRYSFSLECGAGLHYMRLYGALKSDDTLAGPYHISSQLQIGKANFFVPSAEIGISMLVRPVLYKAHVLVGLNCNLFLSEFSEVNYTAKYDDGNSAINYYFRWSPVLLVPKIYAAVLL